MLGERRGTIGDRDDAPRICQRFPRVQSENGGKPTEPGLSSRLREPGRQSLYRPRQGNPCRQVAGRVPRRFAQRRWRRVRTPPLRRGVRHRISTPPTRCRRKQRGRLHRMVRRTRNRCRRAAPRLHRCRRARRRHPPPPMAAAVLPLMTSPIACASSGEAAERLAAARRHGAQPGGATAIGQSSGGGAAVQLHARRVGR